MCTRAWGLSNSGGGVGDVVRVHNWLFGYVGCPAC